MIKNKKAMFFTMISLFLIIVLVMDFKVAAKVNINKNKMSSTNTRVQMLNNFVFDLEDRYFDRMLYIATKNAIKKISSEASFDILTNYTKIMGNDGTDYSITSLKTKMNDAYESVGIEITTLDVIETSLSQTSPYVIYVKQKIKYQIDDLNKVASWRGTVVKEYDMDIRGFEINSVLIDLMQKTEVSCIINTPPCGCPDDSHSFLGWLGMTGYKSGGASISDGIIICKDCKTCPPATST